MISDLSVVVPIRVDDGSTDDSFAILAKMQAADPRVRVVPTVGRLFETLLDGRVIGGAVARVGWRRSTGAML